MTDKRRVSLPVVGQPRRAVDDADLGENLPKTRAPAAWILLGALAVLATLMPLGYAAVGLVEAIYHAPFGSPPTRRAVVTAAVLVVALSSWAGGWIVGRFGGRAGAREGALAGALAGLAFWAMTRMPVGFVLVMLTTPLAWLGARFGRRTRKPGDSIGA
jgi:tRNA-(ms[2]io[6]A)-hydroxylase